MSQVNTIFDDVFRTMVEKMPRSCVLYMSLTELIVKISDYMLENEKILKGKIGDIMGGKVLELEIERRERIGREKNIIDYYKRNIISLEQALKDIGVSEQEFFEKIKEYKMD